MANIEANCTVNPNEGGSSFPGHKRGLDPATYAPILQAKWWTDEETAILKYAIYYEDLIAEGPPPAPARTTVKPADSDVSQVRP